MTSALSFSGLSVDQVRAKGGLSRLTLDDIDGIAGPVLKALVEAEGSGWRKEVIPRKNVNAKTGARGSDPYWFSPTGQRCRSMPDVKKWYRARISGGRYTARNR